MTWPQRPSAWRSAARLSPTRMAQPLARRPLLGSDHEFQMSCVAAANPELHAAICAEIDAGIERLRAIV